MPVSAYVDVRARTETPRAAEHRLMGQVTAALMAARQQALTGAALVQALDANRRLWSALAFDCGQAGNGLPEALRAQIISLALWVSRYSSDVARGEGDIDDLISVNTTVMEGLAG